MTTSARISLSVKALPSSSCKQKATIDNEAAQLHCGREERAYAGKYAREARKAGKSARGRNKRISSSLFQGEFYALKSLLGISVFIHIEIRTNYHDSHFAFTLALIETGGNWDMVDYIAMQIKDCFPTSRKDG